MSACQKGEKPLSYLLWVRRGQLCAPGHQHQFPFSALQLQPGCRHPAVLNWTTSCQDLGHRFLKPRVLFLQDQQSIASCAGHQRASPVQASSHQTQLSLGMPRQRNKKAQQSNGTTDELHVRINKYTHPTVTTVLLILLHHSICHSIEMASYVSLWTELSYPDTRVWQVSRQDSPAQREVHEAIWLWLCGRQFRAVTKRDPLCRWVQLHFFRGGHPSKCLGLGGHACDLSTKKMKVQLQFHLSLHCQ